MSGTAQYVNRAAFEDGAAPSFGASAEQWDFAPGSDIVKDQPILGSGGLSGTRVRDVSRTRLGPYTVGGTLSMDGTETGASPAFLSKWLPRAMGGGTATAPAMANALVEFGALVDRSGDVYKYLGCVCNRLRLSGRAGGLVAASLDILGKTETAGQSWGGSIPALGSSLAYEPFQHADLALSIAGSARTVLDWEFTLDNGARARFANALTADVMLPGERVITLTANVPFTSTEAGNLYGLAKDGAAGTLTLTNSTVSAALSFSRVQIPDRSPRTQGGEVILPIQAQVRGTSWGAEFTATIDITP